MTRYFRKADKLNPDLDLGPRQAFSLDLGQGPLSFAANHLGLATPDELAALGFTAYDPPPPPPPPEPTPETTPLTRLQMHLTLFMPATEGGLGFSQAEMDGLLGMLPAGAAAAARIRLSEGDTFHWNSAFLQPLIPAVQAVKGLTIDQIRNAWMAASVL